MKRFFLNRVLMFQRITKPCFFFKLKVKCLLIIVSLGQTAVVVQGKLVEHHLLVHLSRRTRNW